MGSWTYGYDPNGNLTSQTGDNGSRIIFSYDAIKRITLYVVWGPTWPPSDRKPSKTDGEWLIYRHMGRLEMILKKRHS